MDSNLFYHKKFLAVYRDYYSAAGIYKNKSSYEILHNCSILQINIFLGNVQPFG